MFCRFSLAKIQLYAGNRAIWLTNQMIWNMETHRHQFYIDSNIKIVKFGLFVLLWTIIVGIWRSEPKLEKFSCGKLISPIQHWFDRSHCRIQNAHRQFVKRHFHAMAEFWFLFAMTEPFGVGINGICDSFEYIIIIIFIIWNRFYVVKFVWRKIVRKVSVYKRSFMSVSLLRLAHLLVF